MLKKLLWADKNNWQIAGATFGAFLGLFLLLLSQQFYFDFNYLIENNDKRSDAFLILNKKVIAYKSHFSEKELNEIKQMNFVKKIGIFQSNDFSINASSPTFGFFTDLFFEAIDTSFLDEHLEQDKFQWSEGQMDIPIILSRDYVALYNFGFAPGKGLPQLNKDFLENFSLELTLKGKGLKRTFNGKIVGYSDRIHSILVPENFIKWANTTFGEQVRPGPSRVILAIDENHLTGIKNKLFEKGYEISSGKLIGGRIRSLLTMAIGLLALIGLVIVVLAVLVFMINFQLLITRAKDRIQLLKEIGYRPGEISQVLFKYLLKLFTIVIITTLIALFAFRWGAQYWYLERGFSIGIGLHWSVYVTGVVFSLVVVLMNYRMIWKLVRG